MTIRRFLRGHRRILAAVACALVAVAAVVTLVVGWGPGPAAAPPPRAAAPAPSPSAQDPSTRQDVPSSAPAALPAPPAPQAISSAILGRSVPVHISIPAIDVDSAMQAFGLNPDRTVAVPAQGAPRYDQPGWYQYSPTPGQQGPSVVLGHVDSAANGPSVFYHLGNLKRGDRITIRRADNAAPTFTVDRVAEVPKSTFPTAQVYGNTPDSELRLITCGGSFDRAAGSYRSNVIVYAHLGA